MAAMARLAVNLTAETGGFTAGLGKAGRQATQFRSDLLQFAKSLEGGSLSRGFKGLEQQFGGSSAFGKMTQLLAGGGIAAGVVVLARRIQQAAEQAKNLSQQFARGEIYVDQMVDGLVRAIPVIGDVYGAVRDVVGVVSGIDTELASLQQGEKTIAAIEAFRRKVALAAAERTDPAAAAAMRAKNEYSELVNTLRTLQKQAEGLDESQARLVAQEIQQINRALEALDPHNVDRLNAALEKTEKLARRAFGEGASNETMSSFVGRITAEIARLQGGEDAAFEQELSRAGIYGEQRRFVTGLEQQRRELQAAADHAESMKGIADTAFANTRTPMETYETRIGELSGALQSGALDWNTYARSVAAATRQLEGASGVGREIPMPSAITAESATAFQMLYRQPANTAAAQALDVQKAIRGILLNSGTTLDRIATELERHGQPQVAEL